MKLSQLNDYIQTLATIGAIAGLLLVAYEIRQSSRIALAESYRGGYEIGINSLATGLESGVSRLLYKAESQAPSLTPEEKIDLSLWLYIQLQGWANEYEQILVLDVDTEEELRSFEGAIESIAPIVFSSAWTRAWFYESGAMRTIPALAEAIKRGLDTAPLNVNRERYMRIDERAAEMM